MLPIVSMTKIPEQPLHKKFQYSTLKPTITLQKKITTGYNTEFRREPQRYTEKKKHLRCESAQSSFTQSYLQLLTIDNILVKLPTTDNQQP